MLVNTLAGMDMVWEGGLILCTIRFEVHSWRGDDESESAPLNATGEIMIMNHASS